ncbi:MAG: outer membrane beta-barrel protein [Candidatus Latescibacterota bacterium]|nr:outer membrane beta-barrel protein [Candidatus Latescibacterota bacterium]MEE3264217.1 outer membrane beta-barrel protein [Candidatus Latescibacterota bacterium]
MTRLKQTRWVVVMLAFACVLPAAAQRTDGPEGSEIGHGGYPWQERGQLFVEGMFGAAVVDVELTGVDEDVSETDLLSGVSVGYLMEDWLGFQLGYGYIGGDQKTSIYSAGVRNMLNYEPINAYLSLDAELYSPDSGDSHFGIAPGVGAEVMLTQRLRVGMRFQHDFIFADDNISINRFSANVQFRF